jgi:hypothetical protein
MYLQSPYMPALCGQGQLYLCFALLYFTVNVRSPLLKHKEWGNQRICVSPPYPHPLYQPTNHHLSIDVPETSHPISQLKETNSQKWPSNLKLQYNLTPEIKELRKPNFSVAKKIVTRQTDNRSKWNQAHYSNHYTIHPIQN